MGEKTRPTEKPPLILIDDEPDALETLQDILEASGYEVHSFQSGRQAIEFVSHRTGNLILTDILLQDLNGLKVLQVVREIDPDSAIIMMTGNTSLQMAIDAMNQGAYAYILKPINMEELKVLLKKAVREIRLSFENKKLVDRLQLTNRDMEVSNRRLESLNREMEEILHIVSHDLRSPLINIQGFSTKLAGLTGSVRQKLGDELTKEAETCVGFIQKGVKNMDTLISGLLRLSRIGRKAEAHQNNDLEKMITDIRAVFEFEMKEHSIQFIRKQKFPTIWCRRDEINQVFSNLISNAIRYRSPSRASEIELSFEEAHDAYKFLVKDNGIGIDKKDHERIFKIFERVGDSPVKGEGLGLALVKKIIEQHDGKIWVESFRDRGSTFYFTLPKQRLVS